MEQKGRLDTAHLGTTTSVRMIDITEGRHTEEGNIYTI